MFFKLNWGTHRVVAGNQTTVYKAGDIIKSDVDLDRNFPLKNNGAFKFTVIEQTATSPLARPEIPVMRSPSKTVEGASEQAPSTDNLEGVQPEGDQNVGVAVAEEEQASPSKYGDVVTDQFPVAAGLNLTVYFNGKKYKIVDAVTGAVMNRTVRLPSPKAVEKFLKDHKKE